MAKKIILALIILILIGLAAVMFLPEFNTVNVFIDGENVSVETSYFGSDVDVENLNQRICDYTIFFMNSTDSNVTHLKNNITFICNDYGLENSEVTIDSTLGENQVPVIVTVDGTSMLPTLKDGQNVLLNKTKNIHVGDIVVAESPEYGGIIKRVGDIEGDSVYLISDNKQVSYEYINGHIYEIKGITTWVDISNINGVVIGI